MPGIGPMSVFALESPETEGQWLETTGLVRSSVQTMQAQIKRNVAIRNRNQRSAEFAASTVLAAFEAT